MGMRAVVNNLPLPPGQIAGIVAAVLLDWVRPARLPGPAALHRAAGVVSLASGCALAVWALAERRRQAIGRFDLERPKALVTTGPYAHSRHPMYVGWWFIHLGLGALRGSAWTLATVPLAALAEHGGVLAEERQLVQTFGRAFEEYAERTPRYFRLTPLGEPRG